MCAFLFYGLIIRCISFLQVHLREAPKFYECEEDELFRKDFDRILGDSLTDRLSDKGKVTNVDIAIPMNLKGKSYFHCVVGKTQN